MSQIQAADFTAAALQNTTSSTSANGFGEMSTEDFIRIIFTELANQDPFQPNDSSALLNQLSSIRSIESDIKLIDKLDSLLFGNQLAAAGNLLGQIVGGLTEDNERVLGYVISATRRGDDIFLELDTGETINFNNVETVVDQAVFENLDQQTQQNDPPPSDTGGGA